ncbi:trypsin-like peptidase domain-containing protein [Bosea sp. (in: a-proteobacteria)]|uniref:trypsin-like peptidase domain-containing protein n=1 Tax=Bosea sp. (in: a-proteobacteria) TaxID=1871050 RepID=UPI003F728E7D
MCDHAGIISSGTAFYYDNESTRFLITNWHNISGRDAITKEKIDEYGRIPQYLMCKTATLIRAHLPGNTEFAMIAHRIELYGDSDALLDPTWFEHPELGSDCDVIAIELAKPEFEPTVMHTPVNRIGSIPIPVLPGRPAFIIGYPSSLSTGFGLPIWKSGYIASEPHYPVRLGGHLAVVGGLVGGREIPAFFIDSQTRRGMSGSPVFASYTGRWSTTDPYEEVDIDDPGFWQRADVALNETRMEFVGIYSGRVTGQADDAALGLCWREDAIATICSSRATGRVP